MTKIKNWIRKFLASPKTRAVALMLLVGSTAAFAQSGAGDYTAGTSALTTVAEEIAKYVPEALFHCAKPSGVLRGPANSTASLICPSLSIINSWSYSNSHPSSQ